MRSASDASNARFEGADELRAQGDFTHADGVQPDDMAVRQRLLDRGIGRALGGFGGVQILPGHVVLADQAAIAVGGRLVVRGRRLRRG